MAQRIASFLPAATETLFALGLGERVVGVSHACDEPAEARSRPQLTRLLVDVSGTSAEIHRAVRANGEASGGAFQVDRGALVAAAPDLVVTQATCDICAVDGSLVVRELREAGLGPDVVSLDPHSLEDVVEAVREVGRHAEAEEAAEVLAEQMTDRIGQVTALGQEAAYRPRVAVLDWVDPLMSAGHWVPGMVERVGGLPLFVEPGQASCEISADELYRAEPEVLLVAPCGLEADDVQSEQSTLTELPGWAELPAVLEHRVFALEAPTTLSRPGPGLVHALEVLAVAIQPELYGDDLGERAGELVPLA